MVKSELLPFLTIFGTAMRATKDEKIKQNSWFETGSDVS
jgi:hypothetical protein